MTEGGGKILVNEADLWPQGKYVTTQLIVTTSFLKAHPDVVQSLVNGQVAANDYIKTNPFDAQPDVSNDIAKITGQAHLGRSGHRILQEHRVHRRPDPDVAGEEQQGRSKSRASPRPTA